MLRGVQERHESNGAPPVREGTQLCVPSGCVVIAATSRPIREYRGKNCTRPCERCGIEKQFRKVTVICGDCKSVLSVFERGRWAA